MRQIDHAWFNCPNCGHRSTPPEAINSMAAGMEKYEVIEPVITKTKDELEQDVIQLEPVFTDKKESDAYKSDIEAFHNGNTVTIEKVGNNSTLIKMERSYCQTEFTGMFLEEANSITLKCPECATVLYEVHW